jgi:LMBR1 domain-containing protein 1
MAVWLFSAVLVAAVFFTWLLTFCFSRYYVDPKQRNCVTLFICSVSLAVTVLSLTLIPLDVYVVSSGISSETGVHTNLSELADMQDGLKILYYVFYITVVLLAFIFLPFAYFYFEEDEGEEGSNGDRCFRAGKYAIIFAVVFGVLVGAGFLVKQGAAADTEADWRDRLVKNFSNLDQFISFCIAVLAFLGLAAFVIYVAYGLVMIPAGLWRSRAGASAVDRTALLTQIDDLEAQHRAADEEVAYIRASDRGEGANGRGSSGRYAGALKSKYAQEAATARGAGASNEARAATAAVRRRQREMEQQMEVNAAVLEHDKTVVGRCATLWRASTPLRYIAAIATMALSVLLFAQVLLSTVDRVKHSHCKWSCGFALPDAAKPYFNPVDQFLVAIAPGFPADLIFFGVFVIYIFLAAITGLAALGVRVLCIKLFPVRAHGTPANGLIMGTWLLMFVALVINQQMLSIAPQYMSFGHQFYLSSDGPDAPVHKTACAPSHTGLVPGVCVFTEMAKFLYKTNSKMPFFGVAQFFATLLFLVAICVSTLYAMCRSKSSWNASQTQSDDPDGPGYVGRGR